MRCGISGAVLKGFTLLICLFSFAYYIVILGFRKDSLDMVTSCFLCFTGVALLLGILHLVRNRSAVQRAFQQIPVIFREERLLSCIVLAIIVYHLARVAFFMPFELSDSQTYDALINDMAESGILYGRAPTTGEYWGGLAHIDNRYITTPWYAFEAAVARLFHVHALVISETILPVIVMLVSYMTLWLIARAVFKDSIAKQLYFMLFSAVLMEVQLVYVDQSAGFLIWPTWGKNLPVSIFCPLMALFYVQAVSGEKHAGWQDYLWSFLCSFAACNMSSASMMAVPVEMGALTLAFLISNKRWDTVSLGIVSIIPPVIHFLMYLLYARGILIPG